MKEVEKEKKKYTHETEQKLNIINLYRNSMRKDEWKKKLIIHYNPKET